MQASGARPLAGVAPSTRGHRPGRGAGSGRVLDVPFHPGPFHHPQKFRLPEVFYHLEAVVQQEVLHHGRTTWGRGRKWLIKHIIDTNRDNHCAGSEGHTDGTLHMQNSIAKLNTTTTQTATSKHNTTTAIYTLSKIVTTTSSNTITIEAKFNWAQVAQAKS